MIRNVHRRHIHGDVAGVGALLDSLSAKDDRLWPRHGWPRMRLDQPLGLGAAGGHGPVRYVVAEYEPGQSVKFRFTGPAGFNGHHGFTVMAAGEGRVVLTHELIMTVTGVARLTWPLFYRPLHDSLIEESLDRAEAEMGRPPLTPSERSPWVRILRSAVSLPAARALGRRSRHR